MFTRLGWEIKSFGREDISGLPRSFCDMNSERSRGYSGYRNGKSTE